MKKLLVLALSLIPTSLQAQTYTQMQWGMNKGVSPYQFGININNAWYNLGTVSSTGVWAIPVGNIYNGTTPLLAASNTFTGTNNTFNLLTSTIARSNYTIGDYSNIPLLGAGGLNWIYYGGWRGLNYQHSQISFLPVQAVMASSFMVNTLGASANGPAASQSAIFASMQKDNYLTSTNLGELDGIDCLIVNNNQGDTACVLGAAHKVRQASGNAGGVLGQELAAYIHDSSYNVTNEIHSLSPFIEDEIGTSGGLGYGTWNEAYKNNYAAFYGASHTAGSGAGWAYAFLASDTRAASGQYFKILGDAVSGLNQAGDIIQGYPATSRTLRNNAGTIQFRNHADTSSLLSIADSGLVTVNNNLSILPTIVSTPTFAASNEALRVLSNRSGDATGFTARLVDILDYDTVKSDTSTGVVDSLFVNHAFSGLTNPAGARRAIGASLYNTSQTTSNGVGNYIAIEGVNIANYDNGGTVGNESGVFIGVAGISLLQAAATNMAGVAGGEFDVAMAAGSTSRIKNGINVISGDGTPGGRDKEHGIYADAGVMITSATTGDVGWDIGISFGQSGTGWPITSTGTIIGTGPTSNARTATNGIDFTAVTFSGNAIATPGYRVDGFGNTRTTRAFPNYSLNDTNATVTTGGLIRFVGNGAGSYVYQINTAPGADFSSSINAYSIASTGATTFPISLSSPKYIVTGSSSGAISIAGQAAAGTYNFNLPTTAGTTGQPLISGGGGATAMSWGALSGNTTTFGTTSGTLTSGNCVRIDANGNLVDAGGPCTTGGGGGTVNSGTAGQITYYGTTGTTVSGNPNLTISSGAATLGIAGSVQGSLLLTGATSGTVTVTPQAAAGTYNFNLPTGAGTSGQPLLSGGGGASAMTFGTLGVGAGGTGLTSGTSGGVPYFNATSTMASSALLAQYQLVVGGGAGAAPATLGATGSAGQQLQSGGAAANPSWTTATFPATTAAGTILTSGTANTVTASATPILGVNATTTGQLGLANGGATGATVTVQNNGATTAYNFNLPTTVGTAGYLLTSQAGGTSAMTWTSPTTTVNGTACTLGSTCTVTAAASSIAFPATVSGTVNSGGIPYFNGTTQMSSSAALGSGQIVLGGGAGAAPATSANASIATGALTLGAAGTQGSVTMGGSTSGTLQIKPAATAGTGSVLTFPGGTTDFSATGGTSQVVRQSTAGGALTVSQLANTDITGLGTASTVNTGTSGATIPLLNGVNTWSAAQTFTSASPQLTLGANAGNVGGITFNGNTSGSVTVSAAAAAGTATQFTLPATNGTANYPLVTNGSGVTSWSSTIGATQYPASIGIGAASAAAINIYQVANVTASVGNSYAIYQGGTVSNTAASGGNVYGLNSQNLTLSPGVSANAYFQYFGGVVSTSSGNLGSAVAGYVAPMTKTGANTITNAYGLYVDTQTIGTSNYSIYSTGNNVFLGSTTIGNLTNPAFTVTPTTAGTGVSVTSAAAGGGVAVATTSSGANENMTINAKGSGTLTLQSSATGAIVNNSQTRFVAPNSWVFNSSGATAGYSTWDIYQTNSGTGALNFRATNDAFSAATTLMTFTRVTDYTQPYVNFLVPFTTGTTSPTIACTGGTTTGASVATGSSTNGGQFTTAGPSNTACTVTFASKNGFVNRSFCTVSPAGSTAAAITTWWVTNTASTFVLNHATSLGTNTVWNYVCMGN